MPKLPDLDDATPDRVVRVRFTMAQAFIKLLLHAFDALLHHGVNYQTLPQYKDQTLLDEAAKVPLLRGQERYFEWIKRVHSDINAAIRRKGMRNVNGA